MALVIAFTREPVNHGDAGVYHDYVMAQMRRGGEGGLSCELYNNAGALYLSKGSFGIYDSATPARGACNVTTEGEIDKSGGTAGAWHAVEVSVSGTAGTPTITAIAGATDESTIPASVKAAYQYDKQGYYLTTSKRLLGIVFLRAALALGRIVNCESGGIGFKGIKRRIVEGTAYYIAEMIYSLGAWNMDTTGNLSVQLPFSITSTNIKTWGSISATVAGVAVVTSINGYGGLSQYQLNAGIPYLNLSREVAGIFDSATYNAATAYAGIEWET